MIHIFPGLSRSWNFQEKNPGLSRRRGNPAIKSRITIRISINGMCKQWRRLHRVWGHMPHTFTNSLAPQVEQQKEADQTVLPIMKALAKTIVLVRDKKYRGMTKKIITCMSPRLLNLFWHYCVQKKQKTLYTSIVN